MNSQPTNPTSNEEIQRAYERGAQEIFRLTGERPKLPGHDDGLPTRETLTIAAAATQIKNPADAVQHALALWRESGAVLEAAAFDGVTLPPKFPATLADFLRLIVKAKDLADGTKRLRDFYKAEHARPLLFRGKPSTDDEDQAERQGANEIKAWKEDGFRDAKQWQRLAQRYVAWWAAQKSAKAKESALKRTKK